MSDPVGYYCDHSDEPTGARTHHEWNLVDDQGWVFQHQPNTISAHAGLQEYLTSEQQKQRCPRAVAVYTVDVVEQARRIAVELENRVEQLTDELAKYVGKEPTIAEEMQHLNRCLNAVYDLCEQTKKGASRWENPLPVPEWVTAVEEAADGQRPDNPDDKRRRIYIDGKGRAWISVCTGEDGTEYVVEVEEAAQEERPVSTVREETGSLREIGRTW
ncbi:hypothetical protein ABZ553_14450 [Streptomyces sparsogenes]|uniref:hypothetical protein n=1 Tax=Streptomyces sparsogenes TaxID=67365 RepID=UPI0033CC57EE